MGILSRLRLIDLIILDVMCTKYNLLMESSLNYLTKLKCA